MGRNNDSLDENINEIEEALEEHGNGISEDFQNDKEYDQWEDAHDKYDSGNTDMLENLIDQRTKDHALKALHDFKGPFSKKGGYINWSEVDVFLLGLTTTSLIFILHPLVLTLWIGIPVKAIQRHYEKCRGHENWTKLFITKVAYQLHYYLTSSAIAAYYFMEIEGRVLALGDAGTMAQIGLEAFKLLFGA